MTTKASPDREQDTRQRLINAGLRLFGLHGFEATSTRALALEAGVNLSAIQYHFHGKEGLYQAVLRHIVSTKLGEMGPNLERVVTACADPATSRAVLLNLLRGLIRQTVAAMLGNPESRSHSQIMMQEQIAPTPGFEVFHEEFFKTIHHVWVALLARLTGLPFDSKELHLRAMSIMGQTIIFRVGMQSLLKLIGSERLSHEGLEAIAAICIQQAEAMVEGFKPVCPGARP